MKITVDPMEVMLLTCAYMIRKTNDPFLKDLSDEVVKATLERYKTKDK